MLDIFLQNTKFTHISGTAAMLGFFSTLFSSAEFDLITATQFVSPNPSTLTPILYTFHHLTGVSTDQLRTYHYEWQEQKQQERLKSLYKARERDTDALSLQHVSKLDPDEDPLAAVTSETSEPKANSKADTNVKQ